jgi:carbonic anhydrase
VFDDLLAANQTYQRTFDDSGMTGQAAKGLAVLTCIDTRIDPLAMLGMRTGDAKIIRNAGARVTPDALRSLILATNLLGVTRVCIVQHTDCALFKSSEHELRARISEIRGVDATQWEFLAGTDQLEVLRRDLQLIEACPLLPPDLQVGGFIFDVHDGSLVQAPTS